MRSGKKALVVYGNCKPNKTEIDIKGIVHKEFIMKEQTVNSTYYCDIYSDCMKMCEDFPPNFGDKRTGCCITLPYSPRNFFYQKHDCHPFQPYFSVFPIEDKTERLPFSHN
jgi:hypothetical protein